LALVLSAVLVVLFGYWFFLNPHGYWQKQKEAKKNEYMEKQMLWRKSETMTMQLIFVESSRFQVQKDSLKDYRNEKPTHTEIEYNKMYPTFGKSTDKEFED